MKSKYRFQWEDHSNHSAYDISNQKVILKDLKYVDVISFKSDNERFTWNFFYFTKPCKRLPITIQHMHMKRWVSYHPDWLWSVTSLKAAPSTVLCTDKHWILCVRCEPSEYQSSKCICHIMWRRGAAQKTITNTGVMTDLLRRRRVASYLLDYANFLHRLNFNHHYYQE